MYRYVWCLVMVAMLWCCTGDMETDQEEKKASACRFIIPSLVMKLSCDQGSLIYITHSTIGTNRQGCPSNQCCPYYPPCLTALDEDDPWMNDTRDACDGQKECNTRMLQGFCDLPYKEIHFQHLYYVCDEEDITSGSPATETTESTLTVTSVDSMSSFSEVSHSSSSGSQIVTRPPTAEKPGIQTTGPVDFSANLPMQTSSNNAEFVTTEPTDQGGGGLSAFSIALIAGLVCGLSVMIILVILFFVVCFRKKNISAGSSNEHEPFNKVPEDYVNVGHSDNVYYNEFKGYDRENENHPDTNSMDKLTLHNDDSKENGIISQDKGHLNESEPEVDIVINDGEKTGLHRDYDYAYGHFNNSKNSKTNTENSVPLAAVLRKNKALPVAIVSAMPAQQNANAPTLENCTETKEPHAQNNTYETAECTDNIEMDVRCTSQDEGIYTSAEDVLQRDSNLEDEGNEYELEDGEAGNYDIAPGGKCDSTYAYAYGHFKTDGNTEMSDRSSYENTAGSIKWGTPTTAVVATQRLSSVIKGGDADVEKLKEGKDEDMSLAENDSYESGIQGPVLNTGSEEGENTTSKNEEVSLAENDLYSGSPEIADLKEQQVTSTGNDRNTTSNSTQDQTANEEVVLAENDIYTSTTGAPDRKENEEVVLAENDIYTSPLVVTDQSENEEAALANSSNPPSAIGASELSENKEVVLAEKDINISSGGQTKDNEVVLTENDMYACSMNPSTHLENEESIVCVNHSGQKENEVTPAENVMCMSNENGQEQRLNE